MTTQETSIVFRRSGGHSHDGATSSLIDTTKYSLFDYIPAITSTNAVARGRYQLNNQILLKNFIVSTIEERVLNPQGITIKANTITAREIVSRTITSTEIAANTITADNLVANLVLINNVIRSTNYSTLTNTGWAISNTGDAVFNNAVLRGTIFANSGSIGGWIITSTVLGAGNTALYSNGYIYADNANFVGGTIGGWDIDADRIDAGSTILYSNGYIYAEQGNFRGSITGATGTFSGSLSGASITGATGTFSGTISVGAGGEGIIISSDGYLKGIGGFGVRIMNDYDGATGTQLRGDDIKTGTINLTRMQTLTTNGLVDITGGQTQSALYSTSNSVEFHDWARGYSVGANFIRFKNYSSSNTVVAALEFTSSGANVGITAASDIRLKSNINPLNNGIYIIKQIQPVSFEWKRIPDFIDHGFIAQDLYDVYPRVVTVGGEDPHERPWMVGQAGLIPIMTAAIKELIEKVEILEDRLNSIYKV